MRKRRFAIFCICLIFFLSLSFSLFADETTDRYNELTKQIKELSDRLQETKNRANSLSNQVTYFNNQIRLTQLEIEQTTKQLDELSKEIEDLTKQILVLEKQLDEVTKILLDRVVATYKTNSVSPAMMLLSADGFSDLIAKAKYIRLVQAHDKRLLFEVERTKLDFTEQKKLLEEREAELALLKEKLDNQTKILSQQKADKENLLSVTKSDEQKYKELLDKALAEQAAIEKAFRSAINNLTNGQPVEEGAQIALMGNSGAPSCSTGTHLHFEVTKDKVRQNPADYLKSREVTWYNQPDGTFSFNGDMNWPMEGEIKITQGYGMTNWARTGFYGGGAHTGLDMVASNPVIKAPKKGTLYKGTSRCGSSGLNWVAVEHDGGIITWYFHVQ
jgi:peptidoglycan hydrolase CwlO-like protein